MPIHNVYIGDLSDPSFKWEGGDINGNVPKALSAGFPDCYHLYFKLIRLIEERRFEGRQTDFGGFVAKVKKKDIEELLTEWYVDKAWFKDPAQSPALNQELETLKRFVASLDEDTIYGLVGTEL